MKISLGILGLVAAIVVVVLLIEPADEKCAPHFVFCEKGAGECKELYYQKGDSIREVTESKTVIHDDENAVVIDVGIDDVLAGYTSSQSCKVENYYGVALPYKAYSALEKEQCGNNVSKFVGIAAGLGAAACIVATGGGCGIPLLGTGLAGSYIGGGLFAGAAATNLSESLNVDKIICDARVRSYVVE